MMRIIVLVAATAMLSFSAGFWTKSTLATSTLAARTAAPATISPADLHRRLKADELPVQQIDSLY